MNQYHKIQTVWKRDPVNHYKTLIEYDYSMPEFKYLEKNKWIFTEKVDGTNIRIMWDGANLTFGGKTDNAQIPVFLINKLNESFNAEMFKEHFTDPMCLYCEGYGAKIQRGGGNYKSDGVDVVLFDIKIGDWWLKRDSILEIAGKLNVQIIPIIGEGDLIDMIGMVRDGFKSTWGDFMAEGIVARPKVELKTRSGHRIITKIKHRDFIHARKALEED